MPLFCSPQMRDKNWLFLVDDPPKDAFLDMLAHGLRVDWGTLPTPGLPGKNFLKPPAALSNCHERFKNEVLLGRMLGGPRSLPNGVSDFLSSLFYTKQYRVERSLKVTTLSVVLFITIATSLTGVQLTTPYLTTRSNTYHLKNGSRYSNMSSGTSNWI